MDGASHLVLHGMWPDYGSLYTTEPSPPAFNGSYQGWNQYCTATGPGKNDYSKCHVNGGLCPWANATFANFTQTSYEQCMRAQNVTQCQVEESTVTALKSDMARYAPGYLGDDRTFIDHEFNKHASCLGGYLTDNKTAFFETAIGLTKILTANGSWADIHVHNNRGSSVDTTSFVASLNNTAIPQCDKNCQLSEVWYCFGRDAAGFPTQLITCPIGTLGSNNCRTCPNILIPDYDVGSVRRIVSGRKLR
jgi:ribonuclease I